MPLYLIRFGSLYPLNNSVFFSFFLVCECVCVGGLWSYVHHTADVKILCSDVVRPSGCPLFFSVHAIFDDPVKVIWSQLQEIDVIAH